MTLRSGMIMYYVSIAIAILSPALYHVSQKLTPRGVNPPVALMLTYSAAIVLTALLLYFMPVKKGIVAEVRQLNWASILLANPYLPPLPFLFQPASLLLSQIVE